MYATIARRLVAKTAARCAFVAVGIGQTEVALIDLRGHLPANGDYPARNLEHVDTQVLHHSATKGTTIRSIAQFHVDTRGWPAIAYHFAVGWDGKVYQLNDVESRTNHAAGFNTRSIGVCLIGDYSEQAVPDEVVTSCNRLVSYLKDTYGARSVVFHRDTRKTTCPGDSAVAALQFLKDAS